MHLEYSQLFPLDSHHMDVSIVDSGVDTKVWYYQCRVSFTMSVFSILFSMLYVYKVMFSLIYNRKKFKLKFNRKKQLFNVI